MTAARWIVIALVCAVGACSGGADNAPLWGDAPAGELDLRAGLSADEAPLMGDVDLTLDLFVSAGLEVEFDPGVPEGFAGVVDRAQSTHLGGAPPAEEVATPANPFVREEPARLDRERLIGRWEGRFWKRMSRIAWRVCGRPGRGKKLFTWEEGPFFEGLEQEMRASNRRLGPHLDVDLAEAGYLT